VAIGGVPIQNAVDDFWDDLGVLDGPRDEGFTARILAAGRRNRPRALTVKSGSDEPRQLELSNLYSVENIEQPPLSVNDEGESRVITFNNSLGREDTIAAFDTAMAEAASDQPIIIDLTDTPGGGNTVVARGIMGWFVQQPTPYQIHSLPTEMCRTGIPR
jgi:hypothetical protein